MDKISIISFTDSGEALAKRIREALCDNDIRLYRNPKKGLKHWTKKQFKSGNIIIFIGACGIAVRLISPYVKNKLTDSPVIEIDEKGKYVIPVLSGHFGGANETARLIADKINAEAVITTATDLNDKFAVDVFAKKNGLQIMNKEGIADVSSKVLKNEKIKLYIEDFNSHEFDNQNILGQVEILSSPSQSKIDVLVSSNPSKDVKSKAALWLKPKLYVIGIGCKKGKSYKDISKYISKILKKNRLKISDIYAITSIDIKKNEKGINKWSRKNRVPFITFSKDELMQAKGVFSSSDFVWDMVGVDNVCERAAICACNNSGELILKKQADSGITLAIAKRQFDIKVDLGISGGVVCMEKI